MSDIVDNAGKISVPLVSVCVPVYNVQDFIEECAESLFGARMADKCEFIFVDDCGNDSSVDKLKSVIGRHDGIDAKIIRHEKNQGLAGARNTGIKNARGLYIAHADSDDSVRPDFIETLYNTAVSTNADLVICEAGQYIKDTDAEAFIRDERLKELVLRAQKDGNGFTSGENERIGMIRLLLQHQIPASIWCKFARRSLYEDNKIDWKNGINVGEDVITSVKLLFHSKKTVVIPNELYNYRKFIGFVMKLRRGTFFRQKELEFTEIRKFAGEKGFYDKISDVIELRNAEIKYEFLKNESPLSLRKYDFMRGQKLRVLCEARSDFNKKSTRALVRLIDKNHFFLANMMYFSYRILSALRKKQVAR